VRSKEAAHSHSACTRSGNTRSVRSARALRATHEERPRQLVEAIRKVAGGGTSSAPPSSSRSARCRARTECPRGPSDRESPVLAEGTSVGDIAERLHPGEDGRRTRRTSCRR
jgi:DNA-binding NarL/FixJ family response regulator